MGDLIVGQKVSVGGKIGKLIGTSGTLMHVSVEGKLVCAPFGEVSEVTEENMEKFVEDGATEGPAIDAVVEETVLAPEVESPVPKGALPGRLTVQWLAAQPEAALQEILATAELSAFRRKTIKEELSRRTQPAGS